MSAGVWVSIDGVEAAGKTTLADALRGRLPQAHDIREFSNGVIGRFLARAVETDPHYISTSPVGQSLLFLSEFWERVDGEVAPALDAGTVVIHDRGYLSKYAYQHAVMEQSLGEGAQALLLGIFRHLRAPDVSVVLTAPEDVIKRRLIERDGACNAARLDFIRRADRVFRAPPLEIGRRVGADSSLLEVSEIAELACAAIADAQA